MEGTPRDFPEPLNELESETESGTELEFSERKSEKPEKLGRFERKGWELTEEHRRSLFDNADLLRERAREAGGAPLDDDLFERQVEEEGE
jgi:hypothetical protein